MLLRALSLSLCLSVYVLERERESHFCLILMCGYFGLLFSLLSYLHYSPHSLLPFALFQRVFLSPIFCLVFFFFYLLLWILRLSTRLDAIFYFFAPLERSSDRLRLFFNTVSSLFISLSHTLLSFGRSSRWGMDISPGSDCKGWKRMGGRRGGSERRGSEAKSFGLAYKFYLRNNL